MRRRITRILPPGAHAVSRAAANGATLLLRP
jgi:hypothetical protein